MANTDALKGLAQGASYANPVIGGAFSVFNNIFSAMASSKRQQEAHRMAMAQSLYNAEIQRHLWNTQLREGPSRQVAGMKAAGLNPAMAQGTSLGTSPLSSSPGSPVPANPVQLENPIRGMLEGSQVNLTQSQSERQDIENRFLPETMQTSIESTLKEIGVSDATIREKEENIKYLANQSSVALGTLDYLKEQVTSEQWNRINNRLQLYINAAVAESQIDVNEEQANQLREMTPALVAQALATGNLNDALARAAGILADPNKAAKIISEWMTVIEEKLPDLINQAGSASSGALEKVYNKVLEKYRELKRKFRNRFYGAHDAYVEQHGTHSKPPMQWRPRWTE